MDSEMYSDFTGTRKYREGPYSIEKDQGRKKDTTWHKNVAESLGKIFDKVNEVDVTVGKRLDALAASISESRSASEKQPEPSVMASGGELQDIVASEVDQLLSDVQGLKTNLTGAGIGDMNSKVASLQIQIDSLTKDVNVANENMMMLLSYFKARGTNKPLSIKCGMQDGKAVVHAVDRV